MILEQLNFLMAEKGSHIVVLVISSILTLLITKIKNKRGVFRYTIIQNRLALSTNNPIHGDISVKWKGHDVQNLYMVFIDIENTSSKDYDSVKFKIYSDGQTVILTEESRIDDLPEPIPWHPNYASNVRAVVTPGSEKPSQEQIDQWGHSREYLVPVFNRGQKLQFNFLCNCNESGMEPSVNVSSLTKGAKLQQGPNPVLVLSGVFGAPLSPSVRRGIVFSFGVYLLVWMFVDAVWLAAIIMMIVAFFALQFGALLYRIQKWVGEWISG